MGFISCSHSVDIFSFPFSHPRPLTNRFFSPLLLDYQCTLFIGQVQCGGYCFTRSSSYLQNIGCWATIIKAPGELDTMKCGHVCPLITFSRNVKYWVTLHPWGGIICIFHTNANWPVRDVSHQWSLECSSCIVHFRFSCYYYQLLAL